MPITTVKPERIATHALGHLLREIVLGGLVTNYTMADFAGTKNDTLTIPIRARAVTSERALRATGSARNIVTSDLSESSVAVKLTDVIDQGTILTDENVNLDLNSFSEQVLSPQLIAVAEAVESKVYDVISGANYKNTVTWDLGDTAGGAWKMVIEARKYLNKENVPAAGRILLVGPDTEGAILTDDRLRPGNPEAFGEGALRDAHVGRFGDFEVVTSNLIPEGEAYAFHRSAFAFACVAPKVPVSGGVKGAVVSQDGFSMRHLLDYNAMTGEDRSLVTTWTGGASVEDGKDGSNAAANVRAVKIVVTPADETP